MTRCGTGKQLPPPRCRAATQGARTMEILTVPIDVLVPDPRNPRGHPKENIQAIKASLKRFGQVLPILVRNQDSQVVAGNGTVLAMRELGWAECAIALYDGNDQECRALSVALNRTAELAVWDDDVLAELAAELKASGFDSMDALGFKPAMLDDLVGQYQNSAPLEALADFSKPDLVPAGGVEKPKADGSYFYVEYYGNDQEFERIKACLGSAMCTGHEIDPSVFSSMVDKWHVGTV